MSIELSENLEAAARAALAVDPEVLGRATDISAEAAGVLLDKRINAGENLEGGTPAWTAVKREIYQLLCTGDPAYKEVRKQIEAADRTMQATIIPAIAGVVAGAVSISAGILTPFIGLAILAVLKIGKNVWCKSYAAADPMLGSEKEPVRLADGTDTPKT